MDHSIRPLDIHAIAALAKEAAQNHIPLDQANTFEGHIGAAFAAAYKEHREGE